MGGAEAGRDMGLTLRPGLLNLGSRRHFEVATWPRLLGHLVSRPGHCSGNCLDTVHGTIHKHCSQVKKKYTQILKIFLCVISYMESLYCVYYKCIDLVCEIFFFGV